MNYTTKESFIDEEGNEVVIDKNGDNVTLTNNLVSCILNLPQKTKIGELASGSYWLASKLVGCSNDSATFSVADMRIGNIGVTNLYSSKYIPYKNQKGVRAVVYI